MGFRYRAGIALPSSAGLYRSHERCTAALTTPAEQQGAITERELLSREDAPSI